MPNNLQGHLFIIAPAGSIDSPLIVPNQSDKISNSSKSELTEEPDNIEYIVLPSKDGCTSLINGNGMIYRIDFNNCHAHLSSKIIKNLSYFVDKIAHKKYPNLKFINCGLVRLSYQLGICDFANTGLISVKFSKENRERLLVTWDAGRPYEIDPYSLKIIAPIGLNKDWNDLIKLPFTVPFRPIMSSTHPCFDYKTDEMFTVNIVKSLETLLGELIDLKSFLFVLLKNLVKLNNKKYTQNLPANKSIQIGIALVIKVFFCFTKTFSTMFNMFNLGREDGVYLVRWNGLNSIQKWKLVLPNGCPIKIKQSIHQIGLTEKYVILVDTSFKVALKTFIPALKDGWLKEIGKIGKKLGLNRNHLTRPQLSDTHIYIVSRDQLNDLTVGEPIKVKQVKLQREIGHFLVDYDNPQEKITLHAALNCATDVPEFIHSTDSSIFQEPEVNQNLRSLAGFFHSSMDINRLAMYVIDGKTGKKHKEEIVSLKESREYS
ncbi:MAG TPA: carotenoid oxygenase family protein [Leptolyngbyaceae cyanobacterium]